jgi:HAD superfamily hydrolase (TIGR01509 family)
LVLEKTRLGPYFELVLSNQDVRSPKPDPEIYAAAIRRLELTAAECLVVEDNVYGVQAAEAAGATVLVAHSPDDVNYDAIADRIGRLREGKPA